MPRAAVKVITTKDKMIRQTTFNHEFDSQFIPKDWGTYHGIDDNNDDTSFDPNDFPYHPVY